ncbi:MAG: flavoprotein [Elusimicrobia bacterium]|nr:flavoprotein [Elusimicrobiota bacterium]
MKKNKILFQLTGSIACYKACNVISRLVQEGFSVKTICSTNALKFIGKSTLEGLTHNPVYVDTFEEKFALEHVEIVKWLDLAIICPATANIINKLAAGIGDDYISTAFLAFDFANACAGAAMPAGRQVSKHGVPQTAKPYLIAPAMNKNMYAHPATVKAIKTLEGWGVKVLGTGVGCQACGDKGAGRLLEPEAIYKEIIKARG